jgi:hypothetical protein
VRNGCVSSALLCALTCALGSLSCAPVHLLAEGPCVVRLEPGEEVQLDGSGSFDPESRAISYEWRQTAGPSVELQGRDTPWPKFVPVAPGLYEFELVVRSAPSASSARPGSPPLQSAPAVLSVEVLPPNRPPRIEIENRVEAEPGQWVVLDGGGVSDPDGDEMIFEWSQSAGDRIFMEPEDGRSRRVRVRAWHAGEYVFRLAVTDACGASAHAETTLTVSSRAIPPVAVVRLKTPDGEDHAALRLAAWPHSDGGTNGRPIAAARATAPDEYGIVVLDATASRDPNDDELRYGWKQVSGPFVRTLFAVGRERAKGSAGGELSRVEFEPPGGGIYVFELVVDDGTLASEPALVSVEIGGAPASVPAVEAARRFDRAAVAYRGSAPRVRADAGEDSSVEVGSEAVLHGSRSKGSSGSILHYDWRQVSGPHVRAFRLESLRDEANPRFTPEEPGRYEFSLVVSEDDEHWSAPSFVTVTVPAPNRPPFLHVPSRLSARAGQIVRLAAYAGDPDGDDVTVRWRRTGGVRVKLAAKDGHAAFIAPSHGSVEVGVSCRDPSGAQVSKTVVVTTLTDGKTPVASARVRSHERPAAGRRVVLDGSDSYDPEGGDVTYRWDIVDQTLVHLRGRDRAVASFTPPASGRYEFSLVVECLGRQSAPAIVSVHVEDDAEQPVVLASPVAPRVSLGTPVVLDASRSRLGDAAPVLRWVQTAGPALEATGPIDPIGARRVVVPPTCGVYGFDLFRVPGESPLASVAFAVQDANDLPAAVLIANVAAGKAEVILDGSASYDPEGDPLRYTWVQTAGSPLDLPAPQRGPERLALRGVAPGAYAVHLVVTDGERVARSNSVAFSVPAGNDPIGPQRNALR